MVPPLHIFIQGDEAQTIIGTFGVLFGSLFTSWVCMKCDLPAGNSLNAQLDDCGFALRKINMQLGSTPAPVDGRAWPRLHQLMKGRGFNSHSVYGSTCW